MLDVRPAPGATPFALVRARLHVVHESAGRLRARCPSHGSHSGTLAIREASNGTVLVRCHAGCTPGDVVRAIGLELRDLFPSNDDWQRRHDALSVERRRFLRDPRGTVSAALQRECERVRGQLQYPRQLLAAEINVIRARVARIYEIELKPIAPRRWEGWANWETDPLWPACFEHELRQVLLVKYGDPDREPTADELHIAACRAAEDLHAVARCAG